MKEIEVVAAIIFEGKHVLCVQRAPSKYVYTSLKYEFPGGKVEPNETEKEALEREILEELSMSIIVGSKYHTVKHAYPDFSIVMHSYLCIATDRNLVLHEHVTAQWLEIKNFKQLDWAEADVPIVEKLIEEKT